MRDHMVKVRHRVRYPPFESSKMNPEEIPIAENSFELKGLSATTQVPLM